MHKRQRSRQVETNRRLQRKASRLIKMADADSALEDYQQALDHYQQAVCFLRAIGNRHETGITLSTIGGLYQTLGNNQQALDFYQQALPLLHLVGNRTSEGGVLYNMSFLVDTAEAIRLAEQARDLWVAVQSPNVGAAEARLAKLRAKLEGD